MIKVVMLEKRLVMSDPILIGQILQNEGLTGKSAEVRRAELAEKSNDELQKLLSKSGTNVNFQSFIYGELGWTPQAKPAPKFTPAQQEAMDFINNMLQDASKTMVEQQNAENWISGSVNFVKETFNTEYAKSNVQKQIASSRRDFELLEDSARSIPSTFEDTFKQLRGVKFDEKKIADCTSLRNASGSP